MTNKIVVANLKTSMTLGDTSKYLKEINQKIHNQNVIICPTSIYAPYFLNHGYQVGLQNIFCESLGSCTGEISSKQAKSIGVNYVILGHSERRNILKESNHNINLKIKDCLKNNLKIILCIGETLEERNLLKTDKILKKQLMECLKDINDLNNITIAYEPVWAIGTNTLPSINDITKAIVFIRYIVKNYLNFSNINVIYGGSINEKNIKNINNIKEIDGVLIGGASVDSSKLLNIIEVTFNE